MDKKKIVKIVIALLESIEESEEKEYKAKCTCSFCQGTRMVKSLKKEMDIDSSNPKT